VEAKEPCTQQPSMCGGSALLRCCCPGGSGEISCAEIGGERAGGWPADRTACKPGQP
jgi:hypothetical protein